MVRERAWRRMYRIEAHSRQDGHCHYCKQYNGLVISTADHILARSRGGSTHGKNIVAACKRCNLLKGAMSKAEFNKIINNPKLSRDGLQKYLIGLEIRIRKHGKVRFSDIETLIGALNAKSVHARKDVDAGMGEIFRHPRGGPDGTPQTHLPDLSRASASGRGDRGSSGSGPT